ncbi:MAG TPA: hypothetical protein VEA77_00935, partial [Hyphomicrobium sp.]|nr:hypothetical protein [Hyphomicrobium sp.]
AGNHAGLGVGSQVTPLAERTGGFNCTAPDRGSQAGAVDNGCDILSWQLPGFRREYLDFSKALHCSGILCAAVNHFSLQPKYPRKAKDCQSVARCCTAKVAFLQRNNT